MKINDTKYNELENIIDGFLSKFKHEPEKIWNCRKTIKYAKNQFVSFCWYIFHGAIKLYNYDVNEKLYKQGFHDQHIETALKKILAYYETI